MGQSQSYGQAISTYNEKKIAIFGQVNVQLNENLITEIVVGFGNSLFPQLWNFGIIEMRSTDTDFSLNTRRFILESLDFQFVQPTQKEFQIVQLHSNKTFGEMNCDLFMIKLPQLVEEQIQTETQSTIYEKKYYSFSSGENNLYRKLYKEAYQEAFGSIELMKQVYSTVGILDMKMNNIALGIDNFQMTCDILDALIESKPKIHKLLFISENIQQASLMTLALKEKSEQLISTKFNQPQSEQIDEQEIQYKDKEEMIQEDKIQLILKDDSITNRIIKKPEKVSFDKGHMQDLMYQFFRDIDKPLNPDVCNTIVPYLNDKQKLCLCGRKTIVHVINDNCCYCGQTRQIMRRCEQRACGRNYCPSCMYPSSFYKKCQNGHQLFYVKIQENEIEQQSKCLLCQQKRYRFGKFVCFLCSYHICGDCYYIKYTEWQYEKFKIYMSLIRQLKPHYRQEVQNELITEYLINFNEIRK